MDYVLLNPVVSLIFFLGLVVFWFVCGYIARSIVRGNNPYLDLLSYNVRQGALRAHSHVESWMRKLLWMGPIGLTHVLYKVWVGEESFRLRLTLRL